MPRLKHNEHNTRQIIRSLKESVDQVDVEVRDEEVVITQKENFAPEDNVDVSQNELLTEVESQQLENCAKNFAFVSEPVISRDKVDINVNEPSSSSTHVKNSVTIESKSASKRRHICPYCGHGCAKPSVLQKHIRAHTNERPYPCIPCGFAFKTKSNLYKHCKSRAHFMNISNNNAERSTVLTEGSADSLSSSSVTVSDDELSESNQEDDANAKISSIKPCSPLPAESSDQVAVAPHFIKTNHEISTNVATSSCEIKPIDGVQMPSSIYGTKALNLKLKIPAPDLSIQSFALNSAGSSSSSSSRSSRSPKVTSPEQLELHISKIISENAAIVETFDSLWPRRYMRQSSVGSSQNVDAEIRKNDQIKPQMIKNRRYSDNPKLLTSSSDASLDLPLSLVKQVDSVPSSPFKDCNEKRSLNFGCILSSSSSHLPIKGHKDSNQALPIKAEARRTSFAGLTSVDELMKQAPKRKSSLQFFGGQVEINDSTEPKKLKLEVDKPILGSVCQDSLLVQQMSTNPKSSVFPWMNAQIKPLSSSSQQPSSHFMVTIAKPVLNSGGTVLQVSSSGSSKNNSMCIPVVALGVPVVSARCSSPSEGDSSGRRMESYDTVILASNPVSSKSKKLEFTNLPDSVDELVVDSNANYCPISMECPFPSAESNLNQPSFVLTYNKRNEDIEASSNKQWSGQVPTLTITPESPCSSPVHSNLDFSKEEESSSRNFLAPKRPNSLPLKKKAVTMKLIGTTLVSPETPRPKKRYRQLHLNGNAYTYLGLKRSTRSTWCCIYRPQPMYVHQDANSKLSMYSNWQVVSTKPEFHGLSPGRSMALYDSSPLKRHNNMSISQHDISCIVTHSSYWIYKNEKDKSEEEQQSQTKLSALNVNVSQTSELSISVPLHSPLELQGPSSKSPKLSPIQPNQMMKSPNEYSQERVKSFEPSPGCQSIQKNGSKRVRIFEGGYKCNEEYTYIRGRGRGKYVCEECGIRCKKPSMLKKHIRTHTDLRPYMCKHCSFSFKTKGNLTKHMKSKAHHKKCIGIGVIPVPTVIEDSQIDAVALAKQEELDRNRARQEEEEDDSDDDSSDEEDEDDDEESEGEKFINMSTSSIIQNEVETELPVGEIIPVSITAEQEVAKSLLHLSEAVVPPTQVLVNHIPSSLHMTSLNPGNVEPLSSTEIPLQQKLISANKQHFKEITGYEVLPYSTAVEKSSSSENISVRRQTDDFSGAPSHPSSQIEWSSLFNAQRQPKSLASWVAPRRRSVSETYKDNDRNEDTKHSKSRKYSFSYPEPLKNVIKSNVEKMNKVDSSNTQILDDSEQPMDLSITKGCSEASSMTKIPSIVATTLEQINLIHPLASHSLPPSSLGEEGKCICQICNKHFSKPSQLKLHINIHYIERPFRCESCAISFRTKGHLEKHKRSLSHYNKVNINMTFGIPTAENPRPFKCTDCKIAFRIHGHLAKHLRSKLHIMKLECLGKLPFGTYAEMERSGTNLNEIDTSDCDNFLESIQSMADKMYGKEIAAAATLNDEVAEPSKEILNNYNHS